MLLTKKYFIQLLTKIKFILPLLLLFAISCNFNNRSDEEPIARVYDRYLYASDLNDIIPVTASLEDSVRITELFIKDWVHENVLLKQAELNLSEDQMNFDEKLNHYKNSLIIYAYEQALINEKLDTSVSMLAMSNYYMRNMHNFLMTRPAYKIRYIKVSKSDVELDQLKRWIRSKENEDIDELQLYTESNGLKYYLNDSVWVTPEKIHNEIPPQNEMNFYKEPGTGLFEIEDDHFVYLIFVISVLKQGEQAPLELVKTELRTLILNIRKRELLKKMRKDIYNDALRKKNVEINRHAL
jgi:hypothetical protein